MKYLLVLISLSLSVQVLANDRIIGGKPIQGKRAPWQVSLKSKFGSHFCGAVLIEKDVLLTAAHCVWTDGPNEVFVYGNSAKGSLSGLTRLPSVKEIEVHPDFERKHFTAHDIAILILHSEIKENENLKPISIIDSHFPIKVDAEFHKMADTTFTVSGWGMTTPPNILQEPSEQLMATQQRPVASSNISLLDPDIQKYLKQTYDIGENTIKRIHSRNSRTLLAEGIDKIAGSCSGDSGGPFVASINGEDHLIGVSSYTSGGEKRCLGVSVYTNVQAYAPWIRTTINRSSQ